MFRSITTERAEGNMQELLSGTDEGSVFPCASTGIPLSSEASSSRLLEHRVLLPRSTTNGAELNTCGESVTVLGQTGVESSTHLYGTSHTFHSGNGAYQRHIHSPILNAIMRLALNTYQFFWFVFGAIGRCALIALYYCHKVACIPGIFFYRVSTFMFDKWSARVIRSSQQLCGLGGAVGGTFLILFSISFYCTFFSSDALHGLEHSRQFPYPPCFSSSASRSSFKLQEFFFPFESDLSRGVDKYGEGDVRGTVDQLHEFFRMHLLAGAALLRPVNAEGRKRSVDFERTFGVMTSDATVLFSANRSLLSDHKNHGNRNNQQGSLFMSTDVHVQSDSSFDLMKSQNQSGGSSGLLAYPQLLGIWKSLKQLYKIGGDVANFEHFCRKTPTDNPIIGDVCIAMGLFGIFEAAFGPIETEEQFKNAYTGRLDASDPSGDSDQLGFLSFAPAYLPTVYFSPVHFVYKQWIEGSSPLNVTFNEKKEHVKIPNNKLNAKRALVEYFSRALNSKKDSKASNNGFGENKRHLIYNNLSSVAPIGVPVSKYKNSLEFFTEEISKNIFEPDPEADKFPFVLADARALMFTFPISRQYSSNCSLKAWERAMASVAEEVRNNNHQAREIFFSHKNAAGFEKGLSDMNTGSDALSPPLPSSVPIWDMWVYNTTLEFDESFKIVYGEKHLLFLTVPLLLIVLFASVYYTNNASKMILKNMGAYGLIVFIVGCLCTAVFAAATGLFIAHVLLEVPITPMLLLVLHLLLGFVVNLAVHLLGILAKTNYLNEEKFKGTGDGFYTADTYFPTFGMQRDGYASDAIGFPLNRNDDEVTECVKSESGSISSDGSSSKGTSVECGERKSLAYIGLVRSHLTRSVGDLCTAYLCSIITLVVVALAFDLPAIRAFCISSACCVAALILFHLIWFVPLSVMLILPSRDNISYQSSIGALDYPKQINPVSKFSTSENSFNESERIKHTGYVKPSVGTFQSTDLNSFSPFIDSDYNSGFSFAEAEEVSWNAGNISPISVCKNKCADDDFLEHAGSNLNSHRNIAGRHQPTIYELHESSAASSKAVRKEARKLKLTFLGRVLTSKTKRLMVFLCLAFFSYSGIMVWHSLSVNFDFVSYLPVESPLHGFLASMQDANDGVVLQPTYVILPGAKNAPVHTPEWRKKVVDFVDDLMSLRSVKRPLLSWIHDLEAHYVHTNGRRRPTSCANIGSSTVLPDGPQCPSSSEAPPHPSEGVNAFCKYLKRWSENADGTLCTISALCTNDGPVEAQKKAPYFTNVLPTLYDDYYLNFETGSDGGVILMKSQIEFLTETHPGNSLLDLELLKTIRKKEREHFPDGDVYVHSAWIEDVERDGMMLESLFGNCLWIIIVLLVIFTVLITPIPAIIVVSVLIFNILVSIAVLKFADAPVDAISLLAFFMAFALSTEYAVLMILSFVTSIPRFHKFSVPLVERLVALQQRKRRLEERLEESLEGSFLEFRQEDGIKGGFLCDVNILNDVSRNEGSHSSDQNCNPCAYSDSSDTPESYIENRGLAAATLQVLLASKHMQRYAAAVHAFTAGGETSPTIIASALCSFAGVALLAFARSSAFHVFFFACTLLLLVSAVVSCIVVPVALFYAHHVICFFPEHMTNQ